METSVVARSTSKKRTVDLIGELLNEIFVIEMKHNERILDSFILQNDTEFAVSSDSEMGEDNRDTKCLQFLVNKIDISIDLNFLSIS